MAGNLTAAGKQFIQEVLITGFDSADLDSQNFYIAPIRWFGLLDTSGNELTASGYSRIEVTSWTGEDYDGSHSVKNSVQVMWTSTGGWGTVGYVALFSQGASDSTFRAQITPKDMNSAGTTLIIPAGGARAYFAVKSASRNSNFTYDAARSLNSLVSREAGGTYNLSRFKLPASGNVLYKAKLEYSDGSTLLCQEPDFRMIVHGTNNDAVKPYPASLTFYNSGTAKTATALIYRATNTSYPDDIIKIPINIQHGAGATLTFNQTDLIITIS